MEKLKVEYIDTGELKPYENNAKIHTDAQIEQIARSIQEFGMNDPIAVWKDNEIIEGHGRLLACQLLGIKEVPIIRLDGLTDEQRRAYMNVHNQLTMNTGFDLDLLAAELNEINEIDMSMFGFDISSFIEEEKQEAEEDDYEETEDLPARVKLGDLWQLGGHRLICGDSTDPSVIDRLMGGQKADMVFTDPPYNIASDSKNFAADCSKAMKNLSESDWDKGFEIRAVLDNIFSVISENVSVYVCTQHFLAPEIWDWMKEWSNHYSYCVWSKPNPMPSLSKRHWTWNTELVCYATRGKHTFNFPEEGHALSTWTINKRNGETGHPTEKPVGVPSMAVSHSSKEGDVVLDLFGGSGSTLIACEQLNRKCFMCELDPHYCDVIIDRWEKLTGQQAELING